MEFEMTDEQRMLQDMAREFARKEIAPVAKELDRSRQFPYELWNKLKELSLPGILVPEEYGGQGLDPLTYAIVLEELARADDSFAAIFQVHVLVTEMYRLYASREQKEKFLPILASGDKLGGFALTEPNAGSDASAILTRAELKGGKWILNGTKMFITNCGTDISFGPIVMAISGKQPDGKKEISAFIVPTGTPGYLIGNRNDTIGWCNMDNRELVFEDCEIPEGNLFGSRGKGIAQALGGLNLGRIAFGAICTGLAKACLDVSLAYAKERVQFRQPISKFQEIQFKLADMAARVQAARALTHKAAWLKAQGRPHATEATMAKLYASEAAMQSALDGFQIHGGYGFTREYDINRYYRDAKIMTIGEGTSEICRMVIARALGC
ncbi:acyl-CoA dehydrogenase family protein [Candidatus Deferrimicrobium sp.]|uniref:acyl-CoA dehydrogenase family protein n=1 Tax=Candidatus Deferrimicrobium sp. TaxID=3060586 RepID=UPI002726C57F|nr:acyl-CoA dehydrogenase family protein [Candidatus Deferrimicrobium sp.]MDO8738833.1 acyl-CoA dehydrogenase family protein [Candidatus Deferrimicrobium sp.]